MALLDVKNVKKIYTARFGGNKVTALENVNFSVEGGEYVAIMGESGSGKTTLLNVLASLDKPTSGQVFLNGKNLETIKQKELCAFRRDNLGFVFQDFNLLDTLSLKDNILLPLVLAGAVLHTLAGLFMVNTLFGSIRLYNTALVFTSAGIVGVIFLIFYGEAIWQLLKLTIGLSK